MTEGGFKPMPGRVEDDRLLRGAGRYTATHGTGALVARFVRSNFAHARLALLDLGAARRVPGVVAAFGMAELDPVLPRLPDPLDRIENPDGSVTAVPPRPPLARNRVRFVGEAYALVVATTDGAAAEGAEAVMAAFEELPAWAEVDQLDPGTDIHPGIPGNLGFEWHGGNEAATADAFARAVHRVSATVRVPRIMGIPLEPMAACASFDPATDSWTLVVPTQGAHRVRDELADGYLGVARDRLRVITPDVGGAFGIRIHALPEQAALLGAARLLGRPVAWTCERAEANLIEPHARDLVVRAELALDPGGRFLAVRSAVDCNLGAFIFPGSRSTPTGGYLFGLQGAYRMPAVSARVRGIYTNTTPTGPFRGAGQPEGTYVVERLVDHAAAAIGVPANELRRRNALAPDDFPYRAASGHLVGSGEVRSLLERADVWLAGLPEMAGRVMQGTGTAVYMKVNGMGRQERCVMAVDPATGIVSVRIGSQSNGQGHATTFGALAAQRLDLPADRVKVVQGDTAAVEFGTGTGASSALGTTGAGVARSSTELLRVARTVAAEQLDVAPDTLDYAAGSFSVPGTNRFVTLQQIASGRSEGLAGRSEVAVTLTYTVGCHACRVTVDAETGAVAVTDYATFDDLGPLLQPAIARGQVHGGVAQGLGQALFETVRYGEQAQPVSTTFLDYCPPRAGDMPRLQAHIVETPDEGSDLRSRGGGEAGAIPSMAAIANAVAAATGRHAWLDAPFSPVRVWHHLAGWPGAEERPR